MIAPLLRSFALSVNSGLIRGSATDSHFPRKPNLPNFRTLHQARLRRSVGDEWLHAVRRTRHWGTLITISGFAGAGSSRIAGGSSAIARTCPAESAEELPHAGGTIGGSSRTVWGDSGWRFYRTKPGAAVGRHSTSRIPVSAATATAARVVWIGQEQSRFLCSKPINEVGDTPAASFPLRVVDS